MTIIKFFFSPPWSVFAIKFHLHYACTCEEHWRTGGNNSTEGKKTLFRRFLPRVNKERRALMSFPHIFFSVVKEIMFILTTLRAFHRECMMMPWKTGEMLNLMIRRKNGSCLLIFRLHFQGFTDLLVLLQEQLNKTQL